MIAVIHFKNGDSFTITERTEINGKSIIELEVDFEDFITRILTASNKLIILHNFSSNAEDKKCMFLSESVSHIIYS